MFKFALYFVARPRMEMHGLGGLDNHGLGLDRPGLGLEPGGLGLG
jgi:hypothetical protein